MVTVHLLLLARRLQTAGWDYHPGGGRAPGLLVEPLQPVASWGTAPRAPWADPSPAGPRGSALASRGRPR
ncbi:hypothetical protein OG218_08115 [Kineococcus sp. NBC_00420]|uniref:hypothetical protein n=1 Tax=Kineococcus sp. NBC_00420 TaxID=2903564 RepID=UPI002E1CE179